MTGAGKISIVSTISYGTFSCTLEGFDDPSATTKAIVEYFNTLAADHDNTGAEPRMPDVDMLAEIAGQEIEQQVEVEINDNSVVLYPIELMIEMSDPVADETSAPPESTFYEDEHAEEAFPEDEGAGLDADDTSADQATQIDAEADEEDANALDTVEEDSADEEESADILDEAEMADVELEEAESEDNPDPDRGIGKTLRLERVNRALHQESGAEDEASMSRLLDKANEQLEATESTRRRDAFSHLRAAMASTVADRTFEPKKDGDTLDDDDDAKAYRTDLADAVTPLRPQKGEDSDNNKADDSDAAQAQEQTAVPRRPVVPPSSTTRRPPAPKENVKKTAAPLREVKSDPNDLHLFHVRADDSSINSFADFAKKAGATELEDLLEAAAAYTTYFEGHAHFARPQIMRQVATIAGMKDFGREEGLLSFGQLLRQGKIARSTPGQFKIADASRFKSESGSAAGA